MQTTQLKFIGYSFVYKKIKRNMRIMVKCCIFACIYELSASGGQCYGETKT